MNHQEFVFTLLIESNPVPRADDLDLNEVGGALYLATLEQRSRDTEERSNVIKQPKAGKRRRMFWLVAAASAVLIAGWGVVLMTQNGTDIPSATGPTLAPGVNDPNGDYLIGRYSTTVDGVAFSFQIPQSGWEPWLIDGDTWLLSKSTGGPQDAEAMIFWAGYPDGAYADPCPPPPRATADLAVALSRTGGFELVSGPSEVTIGGLPAQHIVVTVVEDTGCDPGFFYNWKAQTGGAMWLSAELGDTIRVWLVDVDGKQLFIAGETRQKRTGALTDQEIYSIVESIRFD